MATVNFSLATMLYHSNSQFFLSSLRFFTALYGSLRIARNDGLMRINNATWRCSARSLNILGFHRKSVCSRKGSWFKNSVMQFQASDININAQNAYFRFQDLVHFLAKRCRKLYNFNQIMNLVPFLLYFGWNQLI